MTRRAPWVWWSNIVLWAFGVSRIVPLFSFENWLGFHKAGLGITFDVLYSNVPKLTQNSASQAHIAWYNATNKTWHPTWIGTKLRMDKQVKKDQRWNFIEHYFLHNNSTSTVNTVTTVNTGGTIEQKSMQMLGFLRIPKTGSTSILSWAEQATEKGPRYQCFLGPRHSNFPSFFFKKDVLSCPHRTYESTVFHWVQSVLPSLPVVSDSSTQTFSLQFFTIVRDPFDRLVSYFHYVRRIYPAWSFASTPEQNETILAKNLSGWMYLLATQPPKAFHLPYQKGALMEVDFATATRAIQGPSPPRIYTVIQECFDASILLLAETFPLFFSIEATHQFLNSSKTQHNTRGPISTISEDWTTLREQAKIWFVDDFRFYEAAVQQFRIQLLASHVEPSIVQDCLQRLDNRTTSIV